MINKEIQAQHVAFAFDLDGTLVDTEKYKALAHSKTIKYFGEDVSIETYYNFTGHSFEFVFEKLTEKVLHGVLLAEYKQVFNDFYLKELQGDIVPEKGVLKLLDKIGEKGFKIALVTSSEKWMTDLIVEKINISKYFDVFVSGDDEVPNKPAPDPYILAIKRLKSNKTFAFEDTKPGIISAKEAGAIVIGIRNNYNKLTDLNLAKKVLTNLEEFDLEEALNYY